MRQVVATAPARIDLAGGFTDGVYEGILGVVCNVAVDLRAKVSVKRYKGDGVLVRAQGKEVVLSVSTPYDSWYDLFLAAVKRYGLSEILIGSSTEIPWGSGLGGSGATGVALVGALSHYFNWSWKDDKYKIALEARALETEEMGESCGWQDQLAAAFGGVNLWTARSDSQKPEREKHISLIPKAKALGRHLLLVQTPKQDNSRSSSEIQRQSRDDISLLEGMVQHALRAYRAVEEMDYTALGEAVGETWEAIKNFTNGRATTPKIEELISIMREKGASGAKACGAGGEGAVVVAVFADPASKEEAEKSIQSPYQVLSFELDFRGLVIKNSH